MKRLLVGFGDSWTFGSELDKPATQNWVYQLGDILKCPSINKGTPGSSIGHLTVQLFEYINESSKFIDYEKIFMVGLTGQSRYLSYYNQSNEFVHITPEATYRTQRHATGQPPDVVDDFSIIHKETYKRIQHVEWDTYLTAQVIFQFQQYCKVNNIKVYFFSYFDTVDLSNYNSVIELTQIHPTTITKTITGMDYTDTDIMKHPCFTGKLFHPNIHGHRAIAELLNKYI